jgi:hypothetical protein
MIVSERLVSSTYFHRLLWVTARSLTMHYKKKKRAENCTLRYKYDIRMAIKVSWVIICGSLGQLEIFPLIIFRSPKLPRVFPYNKRSY